MRRTAVLLALVSTLAPACKGADNTKIVVAVWSDLAVPGDLDSVRIQVTGTGSKTLPITTSGQSGQATLVAELELVPLAAKNETFTVIATGMRKQNDVVAQTASVSFVPGQSLLLKLFLAGNCRGLLNCSVDYTCADGACDQPIAVPNLPAYDPSVPLSPPDAGVGGNGGTGGSSGMSASGGASGGVGGTIGSGGVTATGGIVGSGGVGTGGTGGSSGGNGGTVASGGVVATGGIVGTGGASGGVGGTIGFGGVTATGGIVGSGGIGTGGAGGAAGGRGGTMTSGGVVASGGIVGTGGVGTGGVGTGGTTAVCQESATQCSDYGLQTCTSGQWGAAVACSAKLVCERCPPAACLDPTWAEWPMPNDQVDVTAGAPNLESYTDNKDGTVTDNLTGLMWQQTVPTGKYTWSQAVAFCPTLKLAGHSDWRLPSRIELVSIVDFGVSSGATINATYFPSTPTSSFWSSSPLAGSSSFAWLVVFVVGYTDYAGVSSNSYVRCVR
jgi:hypothetical protein